MEMLLTGAPIDAATALAWAPVNRAVPAAALDATIDALAAGIIAKSADVIAAGKRVFYEQVERGIGDAYDHAGAAMACTLLEPAAAEGIDVFVARRAPQWPPPRAR